MAGGEMGGGPAGGGGRGMRIVHEKEDVITAFRSAAAEAVKSFGDGRIFIEKFMDKIGMNIIQL